MVIELATKRSEILELLLFGARRVAIVVGRLVVFCASTSGTPPHMVPLPEMTRHLSLPNLLQVDGSDNGEAAVLIPGPVVQRRACGGRLVVILIA